MAVLLNEGETGIELGLKKEDVRRLTRAGLLRGVKVTATETRYREEDIDEFVASLGKDADLSKVGGGATAGAAGIAEAERRFGKQRRSGGGS